MTFVPDCSIAKYDKLMEILDESRNSKIQSIFSSQDPEYIATTLLEELNKALKNLMVIKREQVKKHKTPYWNNQLEAQRRRISHLTRQAQASKLHEDERILRHTKNRHSKALRKAEKDESDN